MAEQEDDARWEYFAGVLANVMADIHILQKVAAYVVGEKARAVSNPEGVFRELSEAVSNDLARTSTGALGDVLAHSVELAQSKLDEFISVARHYAQRG